MYEGDVAIKDIILSQYHNTDFENYRFANGTTELLAIENYYGKNNYGFDYYSRMQSTSGIDWERRFRNLINSFEKYGFDSGHPVQLAKDFAVMDGSHRIMLSWYHNMEFIKAKIYKTERDRHFNIDFFWELGFSLDECECIKTKTEQLLKDANYLYEGVIWPPAFELAENILTDINNHGDGVYVVEKETLEYRRDDFIGLFKGLYHTDILDEEGMVYKIGLIDNCLEDHDVYRIVRFKISCSNPRMMMNPKNYMPQSETVSRIKQWVRRRYKESIRNYEYDTIMHIADNYLQSTFCDYLFTINRDLRDVFDGLSDYVYAVMRIKNVPSQHKDFPTEYYYRSNANILVKKESLKTVSDIIYSLLLLKYSKPWMRIERQIGDSFETIKILIRDFMVFQFELTSIIPGMQYKLTEDALCDVVEDRNIKILNDVYEVIARLAAYMENPSKIYHLDFVKNNRNHLKADVLLNYVEEKNKRKTEKILRSIL